MDTPIDSPLDTVADVIDALGGNTALSRDLGISNNGVANFRLRGEFPERHHYRIFRLCQQRGIAVAPALFGETKDGGVGKAVDRPQRCSRQV